jgi:protein-disulfide isomerase
LNFDRVITVILTVAAVAIAGALVNRELRGGASTGEEIKARLTPVEGRERVKSEGVLLGAPDAPVQLVEFSDLECPFCRKFHSAFRSAQSRFGDSVSLLYVHYPLSMHRFARPAARASECAREQGRFGEMIDAIFAGQDSLGLKTWNQFAEDATVGDPGRFEECLEHSRSDAMVARGMTAGGSFGVQYTPTILINGWIHAVPPTEPELMATIRGILDGASPSDAAAKAAQ